MFRINASPERFDGVAPSPDYMLRDQACRPRRTILHGRRGWLCRSSAAEGSNLVAEFSCTCERWPGDPPGKPGRADAFLALYGPVDRKLSYFHLWWLNARLERSTFQRL